LSGKVYLVGGGPGDPKLLTMRAYELLQSADVVVIDALISPEIRRLISPSMRIIEAGKRASRHILRQEEINAVLVREAKAGLKVVRLKGGDPFIFGRGGEEAEELLDAGVEFEIVPGISSTIAGPAYAGIPVTHRDHANSVTFVTGHESDESRGIDWSSLAKLDGTIVFLMGLANLQTICERLISAGKPADTPVAVISKGTTPEHRSTRATLATIAARLEETPLPAPALIVVGGVVSLAERLKWFEKRPLLGRTIVVTRARAQASDFAQMLSSAGARVLEYPTIEIVPPETFDSLDSAIDQISSYVFVVFTSSNGVERFFQRLMEKGEDARALSGRVVCAVGESTAASLREHGVIADLVPDKFQSSALVPLLPRDMKSLRLLLVRAADGRDDILEATRARGGVADLAIAYQNVPVRDSAELVTAQLANKTIDLITFTSSSTVDNFFEALDPATREGAMTATLFASIGPRTSEALRRWNAPIAIESEQATVESLAEAVIQHFIRYSRAGALS